MIHTIDYFTQPKIIIWSSWFCFFHVGYKLPLLLTNETVLQMYLAEMLHLAPEYAKAITLSSFSDVFVVGHSSNGEWMTVDNMVLLWHANSVSHEKGNQISWKTIQ